MTNECPICYNNIKEKTTLECKHHFCKTCINTWKDQSLNKKCPCCRADLIIISSKKRIIGKSEQLINQRFKKQMKEMNKDSAIFEILQSYNEI
jgi:hypothetical protein